MPELSPNTGVAASQASERTKSPDDDLRSLRSFTRNSLTPNHEAGASGQVIEERLGSQALGNVHYQYVYGSTGNLILRDTYAGGSIVPSARLYALTDANGDITALTDPSGTVVERYEYSPYGAVTVLDASGTPRTGNVSAYGWQYLFQGGRLDGTTGLYRFGARDYDPSNGVWMQRDPIGLGGGQQDLYGFVGNDPTGMTDPSGEWGEPGRAAMGGNRSGSKNPNSSTNPEGRPVGPMMTEEEFLIRLEGGLQIGGGVGLGVTTVGLAAAPEPTALTKAAAVSTGYLTVDNIQTGWRKLYYGTRVDSFTTYVGAKSLQARGLTEYESYTIARSLDNSFNLLAGSSSLLLKPSTGGTMLRNTSNCSDELGSIAPSRALGGGVRNSAPLTAEQMQELRRAAGQLGFGPNDIRFTSTPSIFSDPFNEIWIGPNILPAPASEQVAGSLFERLTARAAIAHEGGHLVTTRAGTSLAPGSLLDEVQASLVGRQLPGLSNVERYQLLRGAAEDARNAGTSVRELLPQLPALSPR